MLSRHSNISIGTCSDPAYIPHHLLPHDGKRPKSRMEEMVDQAREHPLNKGKADDGWLPHRVINQGPVFWLADPLTRAAVLSLNNVVLTQTNAFLIDLHSGCAGVLSRTKFSASEDQRDFQTRMALAYGQDFADSLAMLGDHDVEVRITYTDFQPGGLIFSVHDIATFTSKRKADSARKEIQRLWA